MRASCSFISYDLTMSLKDSKCEKCNQTNANLVLGLCLRCQMQNEATIAPTPRLHDNDATIAPGMNVDIRTSDNSLVNRVGEYDLIEEIARGGMGVVYKANHRNLNRITAIKMVLGGRFSSAEELQRFQVEAESAAKLDHPAIIPIYEIGDVDGQAYFAMKYVDGGSLADVSKTFKDRPEEAVEILIKVAEAVHHAHQRGVLHRDLKPANILLDNTHQPYVADLGLAKSTTGGSDLTHTGAVLGTPSYMPPEQAAGKSVTTAADTYSLGAIMYELIVGRPPYQGDTSVSVVMQVLDRAPDPPSKISANVDRDLELICMKCLERDPEARYTTAQEMADDLKAWQAGDAISVKPPSIKAQISSWLRRNQRVAYAIFATVMAVLVCVPIVLEFLSGDLSNVYDNFSDSDNKPLLFSFDIPTWFAAFFFFILFMVVWPGIGFLNAIISDPKSIWKALLSGVSTAGVLGLLFYALVGWFIVIWGVQNFSNSPVETLTQSVWPDKEMTPDEVTERANNIYDGIENIPYEDRAELVAKRVKADRYASVPYSFGIGLAFVFGFSIPIVYGTVLGYVLAKRQNPGWLYLIRYVISWWAVTFSALTGVVLILCATGLATADRSSKIAMPIIFTVSTLAAFLALRRWRKEGTSLD